MTRTGNTGQVVTGVNGVFHNNFFKVNYDERLDKDFLVQFLRSEKTQKLIIRYAGTSTIPDLNHKDFYRLSIPLYDIQQQKKIGNLLSTMDKLIEDKENLIKEIDKSKNFYSNKFINEAKEYDENVKTISDILYIPEKITSKKFDNSRILRLSLHAKGLSVLSDTNTLMSGGTKYYVRKSGDFIFGKQNIFNGSVGLIPKKFDNYLSSGDVPTLRFINQSEDLFFLQFVSRKSFYKSLEVYANGSGSKRIHEEELLKLKIKYPKNREKIANLLSSMDKIIDLHKQELEQLKLKKKYYLNKIFN
jgi:type I restriction enzyme S subunit